MATKAQVDPELQVVLNHQLEAFGAISLSWGLPASRSGRWTEAMPRNLLLHPDRERSRTKGTVLIMVKEDSTAERLAAHLILILIPLTF